ncbi:MAG: response regulator [Ginsengibacter sp.]
MNKVLVVDDDRDILEVVSILLRRNDFSVMTLSRGMHILGSIQSFSPDLILLDVALAGEDGCEICNNLKKSSETNHIPIVLFSAHYDMVKDTKECLADAFITKPFEIADLILTIIKNIKTKAN